MVLNIKVQTLNCIAHFKNLTSRITSKSKLLKYSVSLVVLTLFQNIAFADVIPNFNAHFNVYAIGMKLGSSHHSLNCQNSDCTLKAISKPQGLAKLLLNESSEETIKLTQTNRDFIWESYEKHHGKDLNDPNKFKVDRFFVNYQPPQILNPATKKSWPLQNQIYDSISLAYAIQFNVLNERPLNNFYLQDRKRQEFLALKNAFSSTDLELDNGQKLQKAQLFEFETPRAKVKVWLLPSYPYFPGRVEVYNREKDKTLTLILQEPPKI